MNRRQLRTRMFSLLLLAVLGVSGGNPAYIEFHKGEESATSRDWNNAITHYTEALRLKPSYAEAYFKRGNAYLHMEKYNRALKDYDEAIRLSPDTATAYRNRAIVQYQRGDYARAFKDYTDRGDMHMDKTRYDKAIRDYTDAIRHRQ